MKKKDTAIREKLNDLIAKGTPKQKAIFVVMNYVDRLNLDKEAFITENDALAIQKSMTLKELNEFYKWSDFYEIYTDLAPLIGYASVQYKARAEEILGYIKLIESYEEQENHLNAIFERLKKTGSEAALDAFGKALDNFLFMGGARLKRGEDGYIVIDTDSILDTIVLAIKDLKYYFECLKAFIVALDEWTEKKKSKKLMPPLLAKEIDCVKKDEAVPVPTAYSKKIIKEKLERGIPVKESDIKRAVFPYYEEIRLNDYFLSMWRRKIFNTEKLYKNG